MDTKKWYKSMTIQGLVLSIISTGLMFAPIEISAEENAKIAELVTMVFDGIGFVMILIGRARATTSIMA